MNLIKDKWIPAKRKDHTISKIAPWEIGADNNPVVEISAPRPDFRGALYQFLIGLLQTAYAPQDDEEWLEHWETIPSCSELKKAFEKYSVAFELYNENGPAFMQDYDMQKDFTKNNNEIKSLLIDSPGENTIKQNKDHFVKRSVITNLCESCTASALFTLQINAPSGGQGHRTGLRGGGPITTLVISNTADSLWKLIWLNILSLEYKFGKCPDKADDKVFPWMGPTRDSRADKKVYPMDVNELQQYWGMPRRIRLNKPSKSGICDICGSYATQLYSSYVAQNYGVSYSSTWTHSLSPYRWQIEKDKSTSLIAIKGKQGGISYHDWLSLTLITNPKQQEIAAVVRSFNSSKLWKLNEFDFSVWCFGYDMDNMKARCWYEQKLPLLVIPEEKKGEYIEKIQLLTEATQECIKVLQEAIKEAWSSNPSQGDYSFIDRIFYQETETEFFEVANSIQKCLLSGKSLCRHLLHWHSTLISFSEKIFDQFALQDTDEIRNMKRIALAEKSLMSKLRSKNMKSMQALKECI